MEQTDPPVRVATVEQRAAMRHPTRHRITLALREAMTVSALARELGTNKGNVAHHVAVLVRVGLVERSGTVTGRGGTGVLYRSAPLRLGGRDATAGMLESVADALVADAGGYAHLRTVRLTPNQVRELTGHLEHLVTRAPSQPGATRHGVFVSVFRA